MKKKNLQEDAVLRNNAIPASYDVGVGGGPFLVDFMLASVLIVALPCILVSLFLCVLSVTVTASTSRVKMPKK